MTKKLKILVTSGIFPPDIGGPASYVPKISDALVHRGHQIEVVCLTEDHHFDDHEKYQYKIHRIKRNSFKPYRILKTIWKIYSLSKKSDIVFANTLSLESSIGAWLAGTVIVHKIVGDYAWEKLTLLNKFKGTIEEFQITSNFTIKFYKLLMNKLPFIHCNAIIAPSNFTKKMVNNWGIPKEKIHVIYNSVSQIEYLSFAKNEFNFNKESTVLVTIGRLIPLKGLFELINVVKNLDIYLIIVGSGPLKESISKYIKDIKLEKKIRLISNIENYKVHSILKLSDIFILNSMGENFPNVILEAMINKVPVICTDVGGCSEIVQDKVTGIIIHPNDDQMLLNAIQLIMNNKHFAEKLKENAFEKVIQSFNFEKMVKETEDLLQKSIS